MEFVADLWLPIVLSAVGVFIASSILHMVIPIHKGDYKKLPGEEKVLAEMRNQSVGRGAYMFPCPDSMKDMSSPEMTEMYNQGPVGIMTVLPNGAPKMGKSLGLWFLYSLVVSFMVAYIASFALGYGASYRTVFRLSGTVATMAYAVSYLQDSIWKGQTWGTTFKFIFDGVVYGLVTAGVFGWLWPEA
jgi:hypothetical protein